MVKAALFLAFLLCLPPEYNLDRQSVLLSVGRDTSLMKFCDFPKAFSEANIKIPLSIEQAFPYTGIFQIFLR